MGHEIGYHYETMDTCKGSIDKAYNEFCRNLDKFRTLAEIKTISMHGSPMSKFDNRDIWKKYDYRKLGILAEPYFDINFNELFYITDTGRRWDGHLYNVRDKATTANPVTNPEFLKLRFRHTSDIIKAVNARARIEKQTNTGAIIKGSDTEKTSTQPETQNTEQTTNTEHRITNTEHQTTNTKQQTTNNKQQTPTTEQFFPNQAMLNFHPQRWNDKPVPWLKELVFQNIKNQGKRILIKLRT